MKLITFVKQNEYKLGMKRDRGVLDIQAALVIIPAVKKVPVSVTEVLENGQDAVETLREYVAEVEGNQGLESCWLQESDLKIGPCVTHPNKIICIGLNYRKHAEETGAALPEVPILFNKFNNALAGHQEDVPLPRVSKKVDYEAELGIVIGKKAKYVSKENALDYVFGYCTANDVSARDLQKRTPQWLAGKSCDKFAPMGPYLVTADEINDPHNLKITCRVNGETRQNSNTSDMIFKCNELVSFISDHMTLVPGDIILTGTPSGVMFGYPKDKQVFLQDGDIVTVEIESLGSLTNRMIAE